MILVIGLVFGTLITLILISVFLLFSFNFIYKKNYLKIKNEKLNAIDNYYNDVESKTIFLSSNNEETFEIKIEGFMYEYGNFYTDFRKSFERLEDLFSNHNLSLINKHKLLKKCDFDFEKIKILHKEFMVKYKKIFDDAEHLNNMFYTKENLIETIIKYINFNKNIFPKKHKYLLSQAKNIRTNIYKIKKPKGNLFKKSEQLVILSREIDILIEEIKVIFNIEYAMHFGFEKQINDINKKINRLSLGSEYFESLLKKIKKNLITYQKKFRDNLTSINIENFKNLEANINKINENLNQENNYKKLINSIDFQQIFNENIEIVSIIINKSKMESIDISVLKKYNEWVMLVERIDNFKNNFNNEEVLNSNEQKFYNLQAFVDTLTLFINLSKEIVYQIIYNDRYYNQQEDILIRHYNLEYQRVTKGVENKKERILNFLKYLEQVHSKKLQSMILIEKQRMEK